MRVAVLCNDPIAHPTVAALAQAGALAGLAAAQLPGPNGPALAGFAAQLRLPFAMIPRRDRAAALVAWLDRSGADAGLCMTFPWRLPGEALSRPRLGWANLHAGPLPGCRGPDPIFWQLRDGCAELPLVLHRMTEDLDAGPILASCPVPLEPDDTYGLARLRVAAALSAWLPTQLQTLAEPGQPQRGPARWQRRPDGPARTLDWASARATLNLVRACNPRYGGALTHLGVRPVHVLAARAAGEAPAGIPPGGCFAEPLRVACADGGALDLDVLATDEGVFTAARFAAVYHVHPGIAFGAPG